MRCFESRVGTNVRGGNKKTPSCCLNVGENFCRRIDIYFVLQQLLLMSSTWLLLMLKYLLRMEMIDATIILSAYVLLLRIVDDKKETHYHHRWTNNGRICQLYFHASVNPQSTRPLPVLNEYLIEKKWLDAIICIDCHRCVVVLIECGALEVKDASRSNLSPRMKAKCTSASRLTMRETYRLSSFDNLILGLSRVGKVPSFLRNDEIARNEWKVKRSVLTELPSLLERIRRVLISGYTVFVGINNVRVEVRLVRVSRLLLLLILLLLRLRLRLMLRLIAWSIIRLLLLLLLVFRWILSLRWKALLHICKVIKSVEWSTERTRVFAWLKKIWFRSKSTAERRWN